MGYCKGAQEVTSLNQASKPGQIWILVPEPETEPVMVLGLRTFALCRTNDYQVTLYFILQCSAAKGIAPGR